MDSELPPKEQLAAQAEQGLRITQSTASAIAAAESDMTHRGPIKGGPAATAQSLHDRQENFFAAAGEVARKPTDQVTKDDAARVQHSEARALGHVPGKDSFSATVRSIADSNAQAHKG
ncbi:hypothetical protein MMYC01_209503 [Madurella mycetomatis]|uniref:SMP domain-containing protein n=1 Tax=Madurella mycetomatis TaxID=100816 RepID=A0A175VPC4_9PEZI|nr:hypothetical protein MMYC01_209968 [Madurella mycetomatis]KXX73698.1 hypothetical protein MMYC01_209503 [Madurella mycetomatis]